MYLISKEWSKETPYYFYKTTNLINGRFYYGSGTDEENYLGSGTVFNNAVKKYGPDNFKIKKLRFFGTRKDAYDYEGRFLIFFDIKNIRESYNLKNSALGVDCNTVMVYDENKKVIIINKQQFESGNFTSIHKDRVPVKDFNGNIDYVSVDDPRYLSGELVHVTSGFTTYIDSIGNTVNTNKFDTRVISGELVHVTKDKFAAVDDKGNMYHITKNDPRYLSGEIKALHKNKVSVKDIYGNNMKVSVDDPRYLSGELVHVTIGVWNWNMNVQLENRRVRVIDIAKENNIKSSQVKDFLDKNNMKYKVNFKLV